MVDDRKNNLLKTRDFIELSYPLKDELYLKIMRSFRKRIEKIRVHGELHI